MLRKKALSMSLLLLLPFASAWTGEIITVTSAEDDGPGTLREALIDAGSRLPGVTIVFADSVKSIILEEKIPTKAEDLTVRGEDVGFGSDLTDFMAERYNVGITLPFIVRDDFANLDQDIAALPELSVRIGTLGVLTPELNREDALLLFDTDETTVSLSNLAFEDANFSLVTDNQNRQDDPVAYDLSATTSLSRTGGVVNILGEGELLDSLLFQDNQVTITVGNATAGTSVGDRVGTEKGDVLSAQSDATADASLAGMGTHVFNVRGNDREPAGTIAGSLFADNISRVTGGVAKGGNSTVEDKGAGGDLFAVDAASNASAGAYILGGGANLDMGNIDSSLFYGNHALALAGTAQAGDAHASSVNESAMVDAGAEAEANASVSGVGAFIQKGDITGTMFVKNYGEAIAGQSTGGSAFAEGGIPGVADTPLVYAYADSEGQIGGGGAELEEGGKVFRSLFYANSIVGQGGDAEAGQGSGRAHVFSLFASGMAWATGGGLSAFANMSGSAISTPTSVENTLFQSNSAKALGGSAAGGTYEDASGIVSQALTYARADAYAQGGGSYMTYGAIRASLFVNNSAAATGGTLAQGGTAGDKTISWANADAYAMGGGAYFDSADEGIIQDTMFIGNRVVAEVPGRVKQNGGERPAEAYALGGAVFVNTSASNTNTIWTFKVEATSGNDVRIVGNTANDEASGIHFGRGGRIHDGTGYFDESVRKVAFEVTAIGRVYFNDPVTVELFNSKLDGGSEFIMTVKEDDGTFYWGGRNVFDANGGATVHFEEGSKTVFLDDYTLTTTLDKRYRTGSSDDAYAAEDGENGLAVAVGAGASLAFSSDREVDSALFDFTNSSKTGVFNAHDDAVLNMNVSRQLLSIDTSYLIADGIGDESRTGFAAGTNITGFDASRDGQYWANAHYDSPYQDTLDAWRNLASAAPSLQALLKDESWALEAHFEAVAANLEGATPDYVMNQASASLFASRFVSVQALELAFRAFKLPSGYDSVASDSAYSSLAGCGRNSGPRFWAGYVGNFGRVDSHGGYRGYRQDLNGGLAGLNWDFEDLHSVGVYGGYTRGSTRQRGISSKVKTDGTHVGLLARTRPIRTLPGLGITLDGGYSYFSNKGERFDGTGGIHAKFRQYVWTVGLGLDYAIRLSSASRIVPFATGRYTHLRQKAANEHGGITAARVDGFNGDRFTTELGARWSYDMCFASGMFSPWLRASWQHEFGDRDFSATANYLTGVGLPSFTVRNVKVKGSSANLGAGFSLVVNKKRDIGLNVGYNANLSSDQVNHSIAAGFELRF